MSVIYVINLFLLPPATQSPSDLSDVDSTPLGEYPPSSYDIIFQPRPHIPWDKGGGKLGLFHHMNDSN